MGWLKFSCKSTYGRSILELIKRNLASYRWTIWNLKLARVAKTIIVWFYFRTEYFWLTSGILSITSINRAFWRLKTLRWWSFWVSYSCTNRWWSFWTSTLTLNLNRWSVWLNSITNRRFIR